MPNLKSIVEKNVYEVTSPIVGAKFLLINEIDKASAGLRNSMLSVMNEKVLFNGIDKIPVPWEVFCASCNEIPKEEKDSPFWDRFTLKHTVSRISKNQMLNYYSNGNKKTNQKIYLPNAQELDQAMGTITETKMTKFLDVCHAHLSDRTLSFVPKITAAVSIIFDKDINRSLIKTAQILCGATVAKQLAVTLEPQELTEIRDKVDMIDSLSSYDSILATVNQIKEMAEQAANVKEVEIDDLKGIAITLNRTLENNTYWSTVNPAEGIQAGDMSGQSLQNQAVLDQPVTIQSSYPGKSSF